MKTSTTKKNYLFSFAGFIFLLLVYILISSFKNNILVPNFLEIIKDLIDLIFNLNTLKLILLTILKLIITIIICYFLSLFLSYFSYKKESFKMFIRPIIAFLRCAPVATVILILIIIVGTKNAPIYISLFVILPIAYEALLASFTGCSQDIIDETKLSSKINLKIILLVHIPSSFNYLLANLLTCVGLGLKVVIMGEVLAQGSNTIGGDIQTARASLNYIRVYSWAILILIIVLLIELLINIINRKLNKN